jgi:apolipoprotein N-acyltransferase
MSLARSALPSIAERILFTRDRFPSWLLPLLTGTLLALAFPAHPEHPLAFLFNPAWAWVALLPLFIALSGAGFKRGFRRGWSAGFLFNLLALYWVAYTQGGGPAVVAGTFLLAAYLGLYIGLFAAAQSLLLQRWGIGALFIAPLLWTGQEYLLSLGELGFTWMLLGHSQAPFTHLIQHAASAGVYGISAWVVLIDVLLFMLIRFSTPLRSRLPALGGLLLAFLLPYLHAASVIPSTDALQSEIRVALVQPNLKMEEKWGAGGLERSFATLEKLSRQAAEQHPDLLVWPETALPCYLRIRPHCRERVAQLVDSLQVPLLTGASDYDYERREPYNAAFYLQPNQTAMQRYAKMHLVPFGERTPFRDNIPLLRDIDWTALTGDLGPAEFAPGTERVLFAHPRTPFAVLICFESVFPDLVRRSVADGAQLLVNITNDSWFGDTAGPYQHAQLAVMRAVENRTSVARCATSGISLFIDPFGRTSGATELFVPAVAVGGLPVVADSSFYTRHGNLFARTSLLVSILTLAVACIRRRAN